MLINESCTIKETIIKNISFIISHIGYSLWEVRRLTAAEAINVAVRLVMLKQTQQIND